MNSILPASNDSDTKAVRQLFKEYAASFAIDLCFQNFRCKSVLLENSLPDFPNSALTSYRKLLSIQACVLYFFSRWRDCSRVRC
jgi:hypothetical protein